MEEESGGIERQMPVITANPTAGLERAELRERIDRALDQLSHEHRTVLVLHEFEELEYKEIARTDEVLRSERSCRGCFMRGAAWRRCWRV